jgi:hypothetical protein
MDVYVPDSATRKRIPAMQRYLSVVVLWLAALLPSGADEVQATRKTLEWRLFDGSRACVTCSFTERQLAEARSPNLRSHGECVRAGAIQVRPLLESLRTSLGLEGQSELVEAIASLAQSVEFELRRGPHMPLDTLDLWKGDCEDKSILAASLLVAAGLDTVLLKFPRDRHMAVAAVLTRDGDWTVTVEGKRYTYIECTGYGWRPGRLPPDLTTDTAVIVRIPKEPSDASKNGIQPAASDSQPQPP